MKKIIPIALVCIQIASSIQAQYMPRNQYLNGTIFKDITDGSGFFYQGYGKCPSLVDFDLDGDLDIYSSVIFGENILFQNEGNMRFRDITKTQALRCAHDTHGIVWADFNNDGYPDAFCANNPESLSIERGEVLQPNAFYVGGDEGFIESALKAGLAGRALNYSCGVTTADINGDGYLDIFVAQGGYKKGPDCANSLFVSDGKGSYKDIAVQAGVADEGNGYSCAFGDYDNDGHPDLFVGNINDTEDAVTFILYHNNGDGTFTDVTEKLDMKKRGNCISGFWADFNNDGFQDLFLAFSSGPGHLEKEWGVNYLYNNNGDGTFTNVSKESGINLISNSRGSTVGDIDNDGDLDIIVTNSWENSFIFLNDGKMKFTESHRSSGGSYFYGHGAALGDLDNDGDLDLIGTNWKRPSASNPGKFFLFENKTNNNNFIKVNVTGTKSNRSAVMSKVFVYDGGKAKNKSALRGFREVTAGNGTFPGNPLQQHFGVDASKKYDIVVKFPSGIERILKNVVAGKTYNIYETDINTEDFNVIKKIEVK